MKCYLCGQEPGHLVQCPANKKPGFVTPSELLKAKHPEAAPLFDLPEEWDVPRPKNFRIEPPVHRKKRSFISLTEMVPSAMFDTTASYNIRRQPVLDSKPHRLWVDEQVAGFFDLLDVTIKLTEQLNACYDMRGVPANLFRTGRWPLPPNPDKDTEWGIDLGTWDVIPIAGYFDLRVRNNAPNTITFRAALEVWTVI